MTESYGFLHLCIIIPLVSMLSVLITYALQRKKIMRKAKLNYENDLQKRLEEFKPVPLIEDTQHKHFHEIPVVPDDEDCFNFVKINYLSLSNHKNILESAEKCIRKYSVGTCGPRGFFGTVDVHLELENRLVTFMKAECGIVYSYGLITVSSCIHCYCKRDTTVFLDERVNYTIQTGVVMAGSQQIITFNHNNVEDFTHKAKQVSDSKNLKILITEAIFAYDGSICPLPDFLEICRSYKIRVLLDESLSIGVLGDHGRGITEHFNIDMSEIDVIMGSLEYALAGHGGFCVGSSTIIHPQFVTSAGFVYSASLPTFCAQAAITSLELVGNRPKKLRILSTIMHKFLCGFPELHVTSHPESPMKVFHVKNGNALKLRHFLADNRVYMLEWEGGFKMNLFLDLLEQSSRLEKFFQIFKDGINTL